MTTVDRPAAIRIANALMRKRCGFSRSRGPRPIAASKTIVGANRAQNEVRPADETAGQVEQGEDAVRRIEDSIG